MADTRLILGGIEFADFETSPKDRLAKFGVLAAPVIIAIDAAAKVTQQPKSLPAAA